MRYAPSLLAVLLAAVAPAQTAVEVLSQAVSTKYEPCKKRGYCSDWGYETGKYGYYYAYRQNCPGVAVVKLETTKYRTEAGKTYEKTREVSRSACR